MTVSTNAIKKQRFKKHDTFLSWKYVRHLILYPLSNSVQGTAIWKIKFKKLLINGVNFLSTLPIGTRMHLKKIVLLPLLSIDLILRIGLYSKLIYSKVFPWADSNCAISWKENVKTN